MIRYDVKKSIFRVFDIYLCVFIFNQNTKVIFTTNITTLNPIYDNYGNFTTVIILNKKQNHARIQKPR